jgi:hypothetical protein
MSIGDVCPKESEEPPNAQGQPSSSTQASPPTQNEDEAQVDEGEDQRDEPSQDDDNDQGGDANDQDKEDEQPRPPLKGKCALGPFLCILVIECQHMCLIGNLCTWMNKVKIMK